MKNKTAISLIVLVIIVLVLSILASVAIISLQDSDIISRTSEAKKEYEISSLQEVANMAYVESQFKTYSSDKECEEDIMSMISESVANDEVLSNYYIVVTDTGAKVYAKDGWDIAYIANADGWQNEPIEKGGKAEGDFVAKFYKQSEILDLSENEALSWLAGETDANLELPNSNAYVLVIEGSGDMPVLDNLDEDIYGYAWLEPTEDWYYNGSNPDLLILPYVTDAVVCDGVTSIGDLCFFGAVSLKNISLPNNVTNVGDYAFCCTSLTSMSLSNVTNVGEDAFYICPYLTSMSLPSVEIIDYGAFEGCYRLTSISLSKNLRSIGRYAFWACDSLTNVYYGGSQAEWNDVIIEYHNDSLNSANIHYNSVI